MNWPPKAGVTVSDPNQSEVCTALTRQYEYQVEGMQGRLTQMICGLVCNDGVLLLVRLPRSGVGLLTRNR